MAETISPKYSIVIPTYNHCDDFLKPCLESIVKYSNLDDLEVIIVANGCTDNTREFLSMLGNQFKSVWVDEAIGYTKATNIGIREATGEYIILMNNDTVLLEQPKNSWIDSLKAPFADKTVGLTGPVKFSWDCGGTERTALAFWLTMIHRDVFNKIGLLDEIFSPGMGEDGDFCIRAELAGYKLVSVPNDVTGKFELGVVNLAFPIWHKGNGTFAEVNTIKDAVISRNIEILNEKYGSKNQYCISSQYKTNPASYFDDTNNLDEFQNEVYDYARSIADSSQAKTILDIGCGSAFKLTKYFPSSDFVVHGIDVEKTVTKLSERYPKQIWHIYDIDNDEFPPALDKFDLVICSDLIEHLNDPDKLIAFINKLRATQIIFSTPDRSIISSRNMKFGGPPDNPHHVREWSFNEFGAYLKKHFRVDEHFIINEEQATQVAVCRKKEPLVSIIIPTYNHFNDAFKECIDAVLKYTNLIDKEVIVVANGCTDGTKSYLDFLGDKIKYVWFDEPIGYVRAINAGIKESQGKYIVTLDNDSILMPQMVDSWINILMAPFMLDPTTGATGPFANEYEGLALILHSGCTMYNADLLRKIGMFDEAYNPGYFSDSDVSMKIWRNNFKCVEVPDSQVESERKYSNGVFGINFPVVHTGLVQTMNKNADKEILEKNRKLLYSRYKIPKIDSLAAAYNWCLKHTSDINEHFPTLRKYATGCNHITEFGTRDVFSTYAFMAAKPKTLITYDINVPQLIWVADSIAKEHGISFAFMERDTLTCDIENTDLLFIDTKHTYTQLFSELTRHNKSVNKYIILHDTISYGDIGEDGEPGLLPAIHDFIKSNDDWKIREHYYYNNGLMILERKNEKI
jgi:GT2 family glycosyltransferase/2-polyprenyl-3-methyl-5-hydroxy-6-metoxy-1,4-benzoquinol methylase